MRHSGIALSDLPPAMQAQALAQIRLPGQMPILAAGKALEGSVRIRQSRRGPNKTEAAFAAFLRSYYPKDDLREQSVTFTLANGLRYTPDVVLIGSGGAITVYEVKGRHAWDDAIAKLKMFRRLYPWPTFLVTTRSRTCGDWNMQEVLP